MTPGTTVEAAAGAIARSALRNLHVVPSSTVAAEILGKNGNISIVVTGGVWQANNHALAGSAAAELAGRCRCDVLLTRIGARAPTYSPGRSYEIREGRDLQACAHRRDEDVHHRPATTEAFTTFTSEVHL